MKDLRILIVGGGIGGLTSAIALRRKGHTVDVIERDPDWSVYGVGIIQQGNVVRAMTELGLIDDYISAGFGFDRVQVYIPTGQCVADIPTPRWSMAIPAMSASAAARCTRCWATGPSARARPSGWA